jgi:hypothetical protein
MAERIELTEGDLVQAILEAQQDLPNGETGALTVLDLVDQTKRGPDFVRRGLRALQREDRLQVVKVWRTSLDGRTYPAPGYKLRGERCGDS